MNTQSSLIVIEHCLTRAEGELKALNDRLAANDRAREITALIESGSVSVQPKDDSAESQAAFDRLCELVGD